MGRTVQTNRCDKWKRHKKEMIISANPIQEDCQYNHFCDACDKEMEPLPLKKWSIRFCVQYQTICALCMDKNMKRVVYSLQKGEHLELWWDGRYHVKAVVYSCIQDGEIYTILTRDAIAFGTDVAGKTHFLFVDKNGVYRVFSVGGSRWILDCDISHTFYYDNYFGASSQVVDVAVVTKNLIKHI